MKDYIKIDSFESIHQAELRKDILNNNGIEAHIVNKRDYLFFIGQIELYTKKEDEKKAKQLIQEFRGLTKINSFVEQKPIETFKELLEKNGISCKYKSSEDDKYKLTNHELYVKNEDATKAGEYLNEEKLSEEGYKKVKTFSKVRQTQVHYRLLKEKNIDVLTVKRKDSDFHVREIVLYVKEPDATEAGKLLEAPAGYRVLRTDKNYTKIEVDEETLARENIPALIKQLEETFELLVKTEKYEQADRILLRREEWIKLSSFADMPQAVFHQHLLEQHNILTVILNEKDSSFLIGDVELYVEESNLEKAQNIIKNA